MKLAKGSKSWILTSVIFSVFFLVLSAIFNSFLIGYVFLLLAIFLFTLSGFFVIFFRDPERKIAKEIVAAADGKIREVCNTTDSDIGKCTKISTFMNIYNVHVNRMPLDGEIKDIIHHKGGHMPAFKKESEKNERTELIVDTRIGKIKIVQIAGTMARRIIPYVKKGDKIKKGVRIGIIRLGSRVDIYLPADKIKKICVKKGSFVKAGEDNIAKIND